MLEMQQKEKILRKIIIYPHTKLFFNLLLNKIMLCIFPTLHVKLKLSMNVSFLD
jgi:hypothetical protein